MKKQVVANVGILSGNWPPSRQKPSLIFLHGAALSKEFWAAQVKALSDIANTIAIDLPGHKDSKGPACEKIFDCAKVISRWIEKNNVPNPILCGLSMGGAIALQMLITRPEMFSSAILMQTGARLTVPPFIFQSIENDYARYIEQAVDYSVSAAGDKATIKRQMKDIAEKNPEVSLKGFEACDQFDVTDRLGEIRANVLVVNGDEDNITPPAYGKFLHRNIPGAELITIRGVGHLSPIEKPVVVNQILREFLLAVL